MKFSLSIFAAVVAFVGSACASNVIDLTADNFDAVVGKGKPALVEFFAPWCGHCKNLAPIYEELADAYVYAKDKVVIAKVDADGAGKSLGTKYGIKGFPTLKWFGADGGEPEDYEGGRDLDALSAFITKKSGLKSKIKAPPPPATLILDAHTFDEIALDENKNVLVAFTAPWCGHCKNMKPAYEAVAKNFQSESDCIVANLDADAASNKPLASKYGIQSFPTLKFFPKGSSTPIAYEGGRDERSFIQFLNEQCGTHRAVGGGLNEIAGRLPEFDTLASKFFVATGAARDAVYKEALELASSAGAAGKHYLRIMEKVTNGTEAYIEKESKRLSSILAKRTMAPAKLDEIKIKANILASFAAEKAGEVAQEVKEEAEGVAKKAEHLVGKASEDL